MIKGLTKAAHKVLPDIPKNSWYVFIRDYPPDTVGVGGKTLPKYMESLERS